MLEVIVGFAGVCFGVFMLACAYGIIKESNKW